MDKRPVQKIWHDHECVVAEVARLRKRCHNDYYKLFTDYNCFGHYLAGNGSVWS
jgi:hypothetical protein